MASQFTFLVEMDAGRIRSTLLVASDVGHEILAERGLFDGFIARAGIERPGEVVDDERLRVRAPHCNTVQDLTASGLGPRPKISA